MYELFNKSLCFGDETSVLYYVTYVQQIKLTVTLGFFGNAKQLKMSTLYNIKFCF